jgi:hypothetical protein
VSLTNDFSFGTDNPTIDRFIQKPFPAVTLQGTEPGGGLVQVVEAVSDAWILVNARWNAATAGFQQQNPAQPSFAFVIDTPTGNLLLKSAAPGAPNPIVWTTSILGVQNFGYINVKSLGAVGDNVHDDTSAILAAQAAAVLAGSFAVYFPPGHYRTTSTLTLVTSITFFGIAGSSTINPDNMGFDAIAGFGINHVTLLDIPITVNNVSGSGGIGHHWQGCQTIQVIRSGVSGVWHGVLVDSSGNVVYEYSSVGPADVAGAGRYGYMCEAVSAGNANLFALRQCSVFQTGQVHNQTVDAFVQSHGYNSMVLAHCGANATNHAFWSNNGGGAAPNFTVLNDFTADHCLHGVTLDDGAVVQIDVLLLTSCFNDTFTMGSGFQSAFPGAPVTVSNFQLTSTSGGITNASPSARLQLGPGIINPVTPTDGLVLSGGGRTACSGVTFSNLGKGVWTQSTYTGQVALAGCTFDNINCGIFADSTSTSCKIALAGCTFNILTTNCVNFTANWGGTLTMTACTEQNAGTAISVDAAATGTYVLIGNAFDVNSVNSFIDNLAAGGNTVALGRLGCKVSGNHGLNPRGTMALGVAAAFPAVPVSNTPYQNTTGFDCTCFLSTLAGTTQINLNGQNMITGGAPVGLLPIVVRAGDTLAITWAATQPTWAWEIG